MPKSLDQFTETRLIAPSLLAADFSDCRGAMRAIRRAGLDWLHLDVMDGHFVPNITFGPPLVQSLRKADDTLYFDCHLMIDDPLRYAPEFAKAGAQMITYHAETQRDQRRAVERMRGLGVDVGVSIKPDTSLESIEPILSDVDLILIMTVEPGFGGQALIPHTLNKVRELKLLREHDPNAHRFRLQVDGGIDSATAALAAAAGADVFVAGSAIFGGGGDVQANTRELADALAAKPIGSQAL